MRKIIIFVLVLGSVVFSTQSGYGQNPRIRIKTAAGDIAIELYKDMAPQTVENFLYYVDKRCYRGGAFFRTVKSNNQPGDSVTIAVIQAFAHAWTGMMAEKEPVALESTDKTGIGHEDGTISMARGSPNSATSSFFICIGDQPELDYGGRRNPDGQGFAAFGKVIMGMEVVNAIHNMTAEGQALVPPVLIHDIIRNDKPGGGKDH